jgi:hypothetical protein
MLQSPGDMQNPIPRPSSARVVRAALNRLIVAGCDESLALKSAASIVQGGERQLRLSHQSLRRTVFRNELSIAVVALGGVAAKSPSLGAKLRASARALTRLVAGPHEGDAYAACARAAESTSAAYHRVLRLTLPGDMRFGIEHESAEVALDCDELARLRFGARLARAPESEPSQVGSLAVPASVD